MSDFFHRILAALMQADPGLKCAQATALEQEWRATTVPLAPDAAPALKRAGAG